MNKKIFNLGLLVMVICGLAIILNDYNYIVEKNTTTTFFHSFLTLSPFMLGINYMKKLDEKHFVFAVILNVACYDLCHAFFIKIPLISILIQIVVLAVYVIYMKFKKSKE